jgi:hypothetical protein
VSKIKVLVLIGLATAASACQFSFSTARIIDAQTSKAVNDKKEAVNPATVFEPTDVVHCVVRLANAPADTKVRAKWHIVNVQGQKPDEKLAETTIDEIGSNNIIDFNYTPGPAGLPAGDYKVDVYLNPKDTGEDKPAKTVTFTVKPTIAKSAEPQIVKAYLAADPEGDDEVKGYEAGTNAFYSNVVFRGPTDGTKVTGKWIAEQVGDIAPNTELRAMSYTLKGKEDIAKFSLTYPKGFDAGRYRIEIYINDSTVPATAVPFAVE